MSYLSKPYWGLALLLVVGLVLTACDSDDDGMVTPPSESTIADLLSAQNNLSTLASALETAGLTDTFADENAEFTVFAPSNAAFDALGSVPSDPDVLTPILQYHVVEGTVLSSALTDGQVVETLQGNELVVSIDNGTVRVNGATVTTPDVEASNGVVHIIDGVLNQNTQQSVSYTLSAQSNDGAIPGGVDATATFWEVSDTQTLVTLELTDGATGASVAHPAHIHENDAATGGSIAIYLSPIDGTDGSGGMSARLVDRSFDEMVDFNGYINIHESVANLGTVVSQGNIGSNQDATTEVGLTVVPEPRSTTYDLAANANEGSVASDGIPGTATFTEVTSDLTLVTLDLGINGATDASVSHPAHIHNNSASEGGGIQYWLSPIDGSDAASKSDMLVTESYDTLIGFDGYINIHESVANLGAVVSQGNIGSNASGSTTGGGGGGDGGGY